MGAFARPLGGLQKENMSKFGNKYFTYDFKAFFESKENYLKPGNKFWDFEKPKAGWQTK